MYRVVIADVEPEHIKNFKSYLSNNFPEFKVVKEITSFMDNMEKEIKEVKADILLADIRMFRARGVIDVMELCEPPSKLKLMLYGYVADEEYMRKAVELGALDYMLKPLRVAEFKRIFDSARQHYKIIEEREREDNQIRLNNRKQADMFATLFLRNVCDGRIKNDLEFYDTLEYFDLSLPKPYTVCEVRIDRFKRMILAMDDEQKHLIASKLFLFIKEQLRPLRNYMFFNSLNSICIIFSESFELIDLVERLESVKNEVKRLQELNISIGIGRTYERPSDICVSYKEANNALRYRFRMGYNTVIPIQYVEPAGSLTANYPYDKEERLIYSTVIGQLDDCKALLNDIFDSLNRTFEKNPPQDATMLQTFLPKLVMSILIKISRYLTEQRLPGQEIFAHCFPTKEVFALKTLGEAQEFLTEGMSRFCMDIIKLYEDTDNQMFERIKSYINEKYYESFSVTSLALKVNTTPDYAHKLFMTKNKSSILDYVVSVRLEKAKKLMKETTFDDDMIAVKIGYDDPRYFRSVFRRHEGITTTEFRERCKRRDI